MKKLIIAILILITVPAHAEFHSTVETSDARVQCGVFTGGTYLWRKNKIIARGAFPGRMKTTCRTKRPRILRSDLGQLCVGQLFTITIRGRSRVCRVKSLRAKILVRSSAEEVK